MVVPNTAHIAFEKAGFYMNVEVRKCKVNIEDGRVDMKHMESLIDSNTILLVGSTPNYPYGTYDPIDKIAKLGVKYRVGVHIDACLGGFVLGFCRNEEAKLRDLMSMDREGVTSISLDQHKFGLAPKGISTLFFKSLELRHAQYYTYSDWDGGLYATIGMAGSKSAFPSAGAWYVMSHYGLEFFRQNSSDVVNATRLAAKQINSIAGMQVIGDPEICALAFRSTNEAVPIGGLFGILEKKGWTLSFLQNPSAIHISVTLLNKNKLVEQLPKDIKAAISEFLKLND